MNEARIRILRKTNSSTSGTVLYWMSRDQRVFDNWALIAAYQYAQHHQQNLKVIFTLANTFPQANLRHYDFMLKGLMEVEKQLNKLHIPFSILLGDPPKSISNYIHTHQISRVYCDFDPLKIKQQWKAELINLTQTSIFEVDAHNIVPCWHASDKREYGAYTLRPKLYRLLPEFLDHFPEIKRFNTPNFKASTIHWKELYTYLNPDPSVSPIDWLTPGYTAANKMLQNFIGNKLSKYNENRNNPVLDAQSNLSPYLHFGHISAQRITIEVLKATDAKPHVDAFIEELVVRRELSDNFCFYNTNYDNFDGLPNWSRESLEKHKDDTREYIYTIKEFEQAQTHDKLWNAAQLEMSKTGKMHGFMRMYWAKKILEWSASPENAISTALYLNDKYSIDGRDPNGYAGCMWAIGGVHDRPWGERTVFGMVRFMNDKGCNRKFNTKDYIAKNTFL